MPSPSTAELRSGRRSNNSDHEVLLGGRRDPAIQG